MPPIPDLVAGQDPVYDALVAAGGATPQAGLPAGKKYIADPLRSGPVTGSVLPDFVSAVDGATYNHNRFRIEGTPTGGTPQLVVDTADFTVGGRLFTGAIPGRVSVDRTAYTRTATQQKAVVFATGLPTTNPRLPTATRPVPEIPQVNFFNAPPTVDPVTGALSAPVGGTPIPRFDSHQPCLLRAQGKKGSLVSGIALSLSFVLSPITGAAT